MRNRIKKAMLCILSLSLCVSCFSVSPTRIRAEADKATEEDFGSLKAGLREYEGKLYYFKNDGTKLKNAWKKINQKWYYFTASGAAKKSAWLTLNGKKYYFGKGGVMQTGWVKVKGVYYYLGTTGAYDASRIHAGNLKVGKTCSQLVITSATGITARTTMFEKNAAGQWKQIVTSTGFVGRAGVGKASEGSTRTPAGVYGLGMAFGIKSNPGASVPYTQVNQYHYWVGDSNSSNYNRFVDIRNVPAFNTAESEHLISIGYVYNYCVWIDYNKEQTPHAGSAFFLHCRGTGGTGGCVTVSESAMVKILRHLKSGAKIVIDTAENIRNY